MRLKSPKAITVPQDGGGESSGLLPDGAPSRPSSGWTTTLSSEKDVTSVSRISSEFSSAMFPKSSTISFAICVRICTPNSTICGHRLSRNG